MPRSTTELTRKCLLARPLILKLVMITMSGKGYFTFPQVLKNMTSFQFTTTRNGPINGMIDIENAAHAFRSPSLLIPG